MPPDNPYTIRIQRGTDNQYYLTLTAPNGEPIATSEGYRTHWNAHRAAKRNYPGHPINDTTRPSKD